MTIEQAKSVRHSSDTGFFSSKNAESDTDPRLLVVEDERLLCVEIRRRLEKLGYSNLVMASSGEEAVSIGLDQPIELILMDILLDGPMDGIDAANTILEKKKIPIIYLTGHTDPETIERAKRTEPFGYVLKPFQDRELQTCIEMALYKHRMDLAARDRERWQATTLKNLGEAVVSTDSQGCIRYINQYAERLLGIQADTAMGMRIMDAVELSGVSGTPNTMEFVRQALRLQGGQSLKQEAVLYGTHGMAIPVDLSVAAIHNDADKVVGVVLVIRNITSTKVAELRLQQSVSDLRRTFEETVSALARTAEKRDPYTAGHQQRVTQLAGAIGEHMHLPSDTIEGLRVASLLHDIGKIYVPAEILSKPGMLTNIEMSIMKTHSEVGYEILHPITFPWPVAEIVFQHHERIDGTGYPRSLSGDEVLLEARILMVSDVVEAMSSHRPYRAALGINMALDEIVRFKGTRYDPDVADACLEVFQNGFTF